MGKIFHLAACAVLAASLVGCAEDNITPEGPSEGNQENVSGNPGEGLVPHKIVKASSAPTRTSLSGLQILWDKGDMISLFNAGGQTCAYTLVGDGGDTSGDFETQTEPETGYAYAIYPAYEGVASGTSIPVQVPVTQTYVPDGFPADYPMAAVSQDGGNFTFSNLATILELNLVGDASVKSISMEALGGEKLAGAAVVDYSGSVPVLEMTENAGSAVELVCSEAVRLSADPSGFRFIVAPGVYSGGFGITVTDTEGRQTRITTAAAETTLQAGTIKDFGGYMGVYSGDFEYIYMLGDGTYYESWNLDLMVQDPAAGMDGVDKDGNPVDYDHWTSKFTHEGDGIYTWTGVLAPGTIKFPWKNSFNDFFGYRDGNLVYHPDGTADDPKYTIESAGNYTITVDIHKLTFDIVTNSIYGIPDELYLIGDGTPAGWDQNKAVQMENLGNGIFQVETVLTDPGESDGFKFIFGRDTWDGIRFAWGLCRLWQGGSDRKNNMVGNDGNGDGTYSIRVNTVDWTYELTKISPDTF